MNSPGNVRFVAAVLIGSAIEDAHVVDFSRLGSFAQHQRLHLLERRQRKYVRNRDHEELLPKPVTDMIRRVAVLRHLAHPAVRHEASNPTREKNGRESAPMTIPEAFSGRSRRPTRMTFGIMPGGDFPLRKIRRFAMANFVTGGRLRPERAQRGRAVLATALPPFRPTPR